MSLMKLKDQVIGEIGGWLLAALFMFIAVKLFLLVF